MRDQVALISVRPVWARVPLALLAVLALAASWYGVRWGIGDTMAEAAPLSYANDPTAAFESAEAAARLAPRDPLAHLTLARLHRVTFDPAEFPLALQEYEQAAALAPSSYLIWTEVGRARADAGDLEGGVAALRRAADLAPAYAEQRWHLGNALLRAGRDDEAFAELRRAADTDSEKYRPQVFNLAWQVYGPDMARVIDAVGKTPAARAQLVGVLAGRGRFDDALKGWSGLSDEERRAQSWAGDQLARAPYGQGHYHRALPALAESGAAQGLAPEKISNGGFESDIGQAGAQLFEWQVTPPPRPPGLVDPPAPPPGRRPPPVLLHASTPAQVP